MIASLRPMTMTYDTWKATNPQDEWLGPQPQDQAEEPETMNREDLVELVAKGRFSPFTITTFDGFCLAIGPEQRKHLLCGARMLVCVDPKGNIIHIPYRSIAHIQEV